MTNPSTEPKDPRVERILNAAEQHGQNSEPDHEVGDLQDVLRAAWSLMSTEQRNQLMAAAETVNVLQAGDDFIEVAELRGCLMGDEGLHRVVIEVTRDGGDAIPRITGLKFDGEKDEIDWQAGGFDTARLDMLAMRLDNELLEAMPPQSVTPAWVSTIDWDLDRDVLTQSVRIEGIDRNIQPSRWRNASEALDRHLPPGSGGERVLVMEISPAPSGVARWVELVLDQKAFHGIDRGEAVELDSASVELGCARGGSPSFLHTEMLVPVVHDGEPHIMFRALEGRASTFVESARVPTVLFLKWHAERPADETLFVSSAGALLNEEDGFARHHLWVDEYHRTASPAFAEPESEFDGERPRG